MVFSVIDRDVCLNMCSELSPLSMIRLAWCFVYSLMFSMVDVWYRVSVVVSTLGIVCGNLICGSWIGPSVSVPILWICFVSVLVSVLGLYSLLVLITAWMVSWSPTGSDSLYRVYSAF